MSARTLTAGVIAASRDEHVRAVVFVQLDFTSGTTYYCNLRRNFDWNGHTWIGVGTLGSLEGVRETSDLSVPRLRLKLSANPAIIALSLTEAIQGKTVTIYLGLLDSEYNVITSPANVWSGYMDNFEMSIGAENSITLNVRHVLEDRERPRIRRYNTADQEQDYSGDKGFEFIESMIDTELLWGYTG